MKKTLLGLAMATLFMAGAVQAEDHSATIDISGSVTGDKTECTVYADSTVVLNGKADELLSQDMSATAPTELNYSIGENSGQCIGKIALQLHGTADDVHGNVLANTETGEIAAKGVGIGVFNADNSVLNINDNQIVPYSNVGQIKLQLVKLSNATVVEGAVHASLTMDIVRL